MAVDMLWCRVECFGVVLCCMVLCCMVLCCMVWYCMVLCCMVWCCMVGVISGEMNSCDVDDSSLKGKIATQKYDHLRVLPLYLYPHHHPFPTATEGATDASLNKKRGNLAGATG